MVGFEFFLGLLEGCVCFREYFIIKNKIKYYHKVKLLKRLIDINYYIFDKNR